MNCGNIAMQGRHQRQNQAGSLALPDSEEATLASGCEANTFRDGSIIAKGSCVCQKLENTRLLLYREVRQQ
jgi:hypothetical protein